MDHFLGKATVLNILGLRFANNFLEPVWNRDHIEKVEIIFDEDLALEGRARYYDGAGALRDMIQSHLLQIMALLAIEPPATIGERDLRDAVATVLRASSIKAPYTDSTRRARYTAGPSTGGTSPTTPRRTAWTRTGTPRPWPRCRWTSTTGAGRACLSSSAPARPWAASARKRWSRSGRCRTCPEGFTGVDSPNQLRIGFGPDTLEFDVDVNGPGNIFSLDRATLEAELSASDLLPYGEVLEGVLTGDPLLSVRGDTAEDCWRIVEPVLKAWARGRVPLEE